MPGLFVLLGLYTRWRGGLRNLFGPLVVIVLATAWQLAAFEDVSWEQGWDSWPVFLVLFGLSLVVKSNTMVSRTHAVPAVEPSG